MAQPHHPRPGSQAYSTIAGWRERTPASSRFAAKFPQTITHEQGLTNCADDVMAFVDAMSGLDQQTRPAAAPDAAVRLAGRSTRQRAPGLAVPAERLPRHVLKGATAMAGEDTLPKLRGLLQKHVTGLPGAARMDAHPGRDGAIHCWWSRRGGIHHDFSHVRITGMPSSIRSEQIRGYQKAGSTVTGYFNNNHYQGHYWPAGVGHADAG